MVHSEFSPAIFLVQRFKKKEEKKEEEEINESLSTLTVET